jgi:hypothetical protein
MTGFSTAARDPNFKRDVAAYFRVSRKKRKQTSAPIDLLDDFFVDVRPTPKTRVEVGRTGNAYFGVW